MAFLQTKTNTKGMGDNYQQKSEIAQAVAKWLGYFFYITLGVMAKLAFDSRVNTLSKKQVVIKAVLSIFVGILAANLCEFGHYEKASKIIVPTATILGESIISYLMTNWKVIANKFLPGIFQYKKKEAE